MEALQATQTERYMATASAATPRAVPVLAADLRRLLQAESDDGPAAQLFMVERALRLGGGGLKSIDATSLKAALTQLDLLGCRTPGIGILRLQMARQIGSNEAHEQAGRLPVDVKWQPVALSKDASKEERNSTQQFDSGFPDTVSETAVRESEQ